MTLWQVVGIAFGLVAYAVAGIWGGRPERFAAGLLIIYCMLSAMAYGWEVNGFFPGSMALDFFRFPVFVWLCLRSDRWWPFVITSALGLMVLTNVVRLLDPAFSQYALGSAHVGLGYLIDLTLLLSVFERQLAGEPAAGAAAWARAHRITATRRTHSDDPPAAETPLAAGVAGKKVGRSGRGEPAEAGIT